MPNWVSNAWTLIKSGSKSLISRSWRVLSAIAGWLFMRTSIAVNAANHDNEERVHGWIYIFVVLSLLMLTLLSAVVGFPIEFRNPMSGIFVACIIYVLLSLRMTKKGESATVWIFNIAVWRTGPGLVFVPWLIGSMIAVPRAIRQREFPDEPEKVFKEADEKPLPVGMVRPIRITTGGPEKKNTYLGGPHLNHQMTVEQNASVRYHVDPKRPFDFLIRIPGETVEERFEYAEKQMADTIVAVLRDEYTTDGHPDPADPEKRIVIGPRSIGGVIANMHIIQDRVQAALERVTNPWGINIDELAIKSPDITKLVNEKLRDIPAASAFKDAEEMRGRGEGLRKRRYLEEEAAGAKKAAVDMGMDAQTVFALEKAAAIIGPTDKVVLGGAGVAEAVAVGATIVDSLKKLPAKGASNPGGRK